MDAATKAKIKKAQKMYLDADMGTVSWDDYYATVEMLSMDMNQDYVATRNLVENGPCL